MQQPEADAGALGELRIQDLLRVSIDAEGACAVVARPMPKGSAMVAYCAAVTDVAGNRGRPDAQRVLFDGFGDVIGEDGGELIVVLQALNDLVGNEDHPGEAW